VLANGFNFEAPHGRRPTEAVHFILGPQELLKSASLKVCKSPNLQVRKSANLQIYKSANLQVCKSAKKK
jgi:hypothetical protein